MRKKVAIIIIAHKPNLTDFEKISLAQCVKILGKHPIFIVCPEQMNVNEYVRISDQLVFDFIPPHWQASYKSFNRLKIMPFLYRRYQKFEYILFYELDAFVFRDDLNLWIEKGYAYVGAPWQSGWTEAKEESVFTGVGNGGFSLRNVKKCLKVINRFSLITPPREFFAGWRKSNLRGKIRMLFISPIKILFRNNTFHLFNGFYGHEDIFWGLIAKKNFYWFNVCPIEEAISFSFEVNPKKLFKMNNYELPFGCHAWWKYDLEFWKSHVEKEGFSLS